MFIVIMRCFYFIYVKMSCLCRVPLKVGLVQPHMVKTGSGVKAYVKSRFHVYCQTPDLGQGLEFDFTFANNKKNNKNNKNNNNPHLNSPGWDGTRGLKTGTQT